MDDAFLYAAVIIAGVLAGFINTLAGSGSAITLPLLIFLGLPPSVANGTNRIGVLFQTGVSTVSFHRAGVIPWRSTLILLIPSIVGGLLGAMIAVDLNEQMMKWAIGGMLILTFFLLILRPQRWLQPRIDGDRPIDWRDFVIFFLIGLYGGFIQAGVGIFLLVGLVMGIGFDLVGANAIKSVLVLGLNIFAFVVFVRAGQVDWVLGFILAIGNVIGAWVAVRMAIKPGAQVWIYRLLLVVIVVSAARMFLSA